MPPIEGGAPWLTAAPLIPGVARSFSLSVSKNATFAVMFG